MSGGITVEPFRASQQQAVEALINRNLLEHFGVLRPELNPDLYDIAASFRAGVFMVATLADGTLAGTGGLMPEGPGVGRVARMHTAPEHRRFGVATKVLNALETRARSLGYGRLLLETNLDWHEAIAFYQRQGYREVQRNHLGIEFRKQLEPKP